MMNKYEIQVNAILQVLAKNEIEAREQLQDKLKLWLHSKSIIMSPATLIKKGNN